MQGSLDDRQIKNASPGSSRRPRCSLRRSRAQAQAGKAPDALIKQVSTDVLDAVKADKAIQARRRAARSSRWSTRRSCRYVNFQRMTASAVGRYWRQATPEQQKRLQDEFKMLLVRTYSGALDAGEQDQTVELKPMRAAADRQRGRRAHRDHAARATRSSSTTGSRRPATAGRSTTSTCSASGWSRTIATASRRRSAPTASTA